MVVAEEILERTRVSKKAWVSIGPPWQTHEIEVKVWRHAADHATIAAIRLTLRLEDYERSR